MLPVSIQQKNDVLATFPSGFCKFNHLGGKGHFTFPTRWSFHKHFSCVGFERDLLMQIKLSIMAGR